MRKLFVSNPGFDANISVHKRFLSEIRGFYPAGATIAYWGANQCAPSLSVDGQYARISQRDLKPFAELEYEA